MTQVVLFKLSPHCIRQIVICVSVILQMHFDVMQELVVLGEYRNDGDLKLIR